MQDLTVIDVEKQLAKVVEGIANAEHLAATFAPHFQAFREQGQAAMLVKPDEPKKARTVRLALKQIRVDAEKARKALKEDALRTGKAIDGYHAVLEHALVPIENAMKEIEEAEERREAARKAELASARKAELLPFCDPTHYALADMPEPQYQQLLAGAKAAKAAADEAAAQVERDRIAAAERAAAEAEAARLAAIAERERLEKEAAEARAAAAEAERKAAAERAAAEAERQRLAAEQAERDRLAKAEADRVAAENAKREAELKAERDRIAAAAEAEQARLKAEADKAAAERDRLAKAEADRVAAENARAAEQAEAARKAARAPDKQKLLAYANALAGQVLPPMTTPATVALAQKIEAEVQALVQRIRDAAERL